MTSINDDYGVGGHAVERADKAERETAQRERDAEREGRKMMGLPRFRFAVVDRDGFFGDWTRVYSRHATKEAAVRKATRERVHIPGNQPNQSCAMVIAIDDAAVGQKISRDSIRRVYPVVW